MAEVGDVINACLKNTFRQAFLYSETTYVETARPYSGQARV
ncbi:hypothetical protein HMPREF9370_0054 [Neisseria wadsworthii 9715]|uniref:Uncharacterized protein n=1 Tax=Neisseria wadsworthii 9715 TaxID=1030841 RepID=G4CLU5_9NEIS|nr:hypothetical protein HMPREF9370_0054 [Neisseria wadsworthii 9715]